jgi:hypothetical protein
LLALSLCAGAPVWAGAGGGTVVLGTISTASGSSANLGSLVLTDYKVIELWFFNVSHNRIDNASILCGNSTSDDVAISTVYSSADALNGFAKIDLADGFGVSILERDDDRTPHGVRFDTALSTASTTITVAPSAGSFTGGEIRVVGYR